MGMTKELYLKYRTKNASRVWVYLLNHPCVDCGNDDPYVLQFDHVRGEKHKNVSKMLSGTYGWDTIQREIDKCEVRCANCHMKITRIRAGDKLWMTPEMIREAQEYFDGVYSSGEEAILIRS